MKLDAVMTGVKEFRKALKQSKVDVKPYMASVLNKARNQVYSATSEPVGWSQEIRSILALKAKDVKKALYKGRNATKDKLYTSTGVNKGRKLGLIDFGAKQTKKGVSYRIDKRKPRKTAPSAFIANAKKGGKASGDVASKQVFKRKTESSKYDGRLPIYKLTAPSVWGIVVKNNIDKRIRRAAKYRLEFQMNQKAEELVRRFGKG